MPRAKNELSRISVFEPSWESEVMEREDCQEADRLVYVKDGDAEETLDNNG